MTMSEAIPENDRADMQREEVYALEAIFDGALQLQSSRLDGGDDFEFPIVYRVNLNEMDVDTENTGVGSSNDGTTNWPKRPLVVEIQYPRNYPSDVDDDDVDPTTAVPSFELLHENTVLEFPSNASEKLLAILRDTAQNERGMPCVLSCLYAARDFLDADREWKEDSERTSDPISGQSSKNDLGSTNVMNSSYESIPKHDTIYACISTHHLFDHKPDNLLKTGHKCHLSGFYKFGTPGIAIAWGDESSIDDFLHILKRAMPQKKIEIVFLRSWGEEDQIPQGWKCVDPPSLRDELSKIGVPEDDYYAALGLKNSNYRDSNSKEGGKIRKSKNAKQLY